ncbi:MAG: type I methionyl aminopeptidase [Bacteroidales bacterium]|nr:type I methionyl aminopeptidase [Bacteroidales bacterium]
MIIYKTDSEIELIRKSNIILGKAHGEVAKYIEPGVKTSKLDKIAEEFIRDNGAIPAFLNYHGFPNTLCISVNDVVVHGIPSDYEIKDGDIVSVDGGTILDGFYGDSAFTYAVGEVEESVWNLMQITLNSLYKGIEVSKIGNRIGDIGFVVQRYAETNGCSVVREMTGHGIGKHLHEDPSVPNHGRQGSGKKIKRGMTIAIEPMVNLGDHRIFIEEDGWTAKTIDGLPSAHYELSVAIKENGADIMSTFEYIYQAIEQNKNITAPKL